MHDSVKAGLCNQLTLEHVVPVRDWQLTCKDCCLSVVSVIYDLLKIVLQLPFQPDHAKVVYDKQVMCDELAEEVGLPSFLESRLDAMTDKHKQSVIANKYRNCEQEAYELLFCIIAYNTLSRLKSSDDVSDDENAKENLVKVSSHPILPMWYRKNVNLHTFTVL